MMDRGEFANWELDQCWDEPDYSDDMTYDEKKGLEDERARRAASRLEDARRNRA